MSGTGPSEETNPSTDQEPDRRWRAELACGYSVIEGYGPPPHLGQKFICERDAERGRKEEVVRVWWLVPERPRRKLHWGRSDAC